MKMEKCHAMDNANVVCNMVLMFPARVPDGPDISLDLTGTVKCQALLRLTNYAR